MKQKEKIDSNNLIGEKKADSSITAFCQNTDDEKAKKNKKKTEKEQKHKNVESDNLICEKPILTENDIRKKRNKKTRVALSCFVLILAVGVVGNWYWENSDISSKISTVSSEKTKTLGEATFVDATTEATTENEYFSSARIERQNARDESLEKLQKVIDSADENEQAHKDAADRIAVLSNYISIENKIETLVTSKGVSNCIAVINDSGETVDIIVDVPDLTDTVILQIKEIAVAQLGCSYEDVTIIQSK